MTNVLSPLQIPNWKARSLFSVWCDFIEGFCPWQQNSWHYQNLLPCLHDLWSKLLDLSEHNPGATSRYVVPTTSPDSSWMMTRSKHGVVVYSNKIEKTTVKDKQRVWYSAYGYCNYNYTLYICISQIYHSCQYVSMICAEIQPGECIKHFDIQAIEQLHNQPSLSCHVDSIPCRWQHLLKLLQPKLL